ncbi:MAG: SDR family NAD(P)-dependent oxidoreductase [Pseudomonadota bacterium]
MSIWTKRMTPADGSVWLTGASAGIGRAVALALADDGWTVWATARSADKLEALAAERPGKIRALPCDVTDREGMAKAVETITAEGPLALTILNAGLYIPMRAQEFDAGKAATTFDVNLNGVANGLDPVLKNMIERRDGHVAITASVAGYRGLPRASAYAATKAALINMAECLAYDMIDLNVRISVINPGFVKTEATAVNDFEMPFAMETDEAAKRILDGLKKPGFEIAFPTRFEMILKTLGLLPNRWYLTVMRKMMGWDANVK